MTLLSLVKGQTRAWISDRNQLELREPSGPGGCVRTAHGSADTRRQTRGRAWLWHIKSTLLRCDYVGKLFQGLGERPPGDLQRHKEERLVQDFSGVSELELYTR